ncbi:DUF924 domain-containing protein [Sphingomonas sp. MMSM20]|uniref:DUF924 family protein n=1 Tax=Sphingomonas lycopersici TaxID=2951807 RepID=UPI002237556E|nr:DUF924 family protein [Sphingomonas lycopersici]MCW6529513.1 DUF924 domain-containing protein [Sphingomonas lycopersici]
MRDVQVHEKAGEVIDFWFSLAPKWHFIPDPALDREIADRFGATRQAVFATGAADWQDNHDSLLAAVILLDQFSRNIHRDTPAAFEADPLAASLTVSAIDREWDEHYPVDRRIFLYMPLMHAEDAALQRLSVEKYVALGEPEQLRYAHEHADVIARFGRFPTRNAALGRESTAEEKDYLSQPGVGW